MFVNRRTVTIDWGDCDPAGIVFYPRYFAMFDASTAALFGAALAITKHEILKRYRIIGFPMVDTRAKFYVPSSFGDIVTIESRVRRFGGSSFEVDHRLMRGDALAVECQEKRVWAERNPDKPDGIRGVSVPQEVRESLLQQSVNTGEHHGLY
jgi:4-hydroxybenzoyl-CoA thioesterase